MNQIKGPGCEHMKFLTFGTSLHKMKHPNVEDIFVNFIFIIGWAYSVEINVDLKFLIFICRIHQT